MTTEAPISTTSASTATTQPAQGLTYTTTPIQSQYDGQVIENLDIYVTNGDAVTITHDNVILRNCLIHHVDGDGVVVSGANGVTIENTEVINADPPAGIDPETSPNINNINAENASNLTVHNTTVREGSTGIYLVNSPGASLSRVDGYDFHGPMPRGQFVQFNNSGNSSLTDFHAVNDAGSSHPEDIVSVYGSPNTTISNGVIDGNNSQTGVAVMFENGSTGGRVDHVDAIHQGNGAFSSYASDVTFDHTRSFDGIDEDQGRGLPSSNGLIWNVSSGGVSILNSSYTNPGNPNNIIWDASKAVVADVHEDPTATPVAHVDNQFTWDYAADSSTGTVTDASVTSSITGSTGTDTGSGTGTVPPSGDTSDGTLYGTSGADVLHGTSGHTMIGYGGNDTYYVDNANEKVVEAVGGGNDSVIASVSYALSAGSEIEHLATNNPSGTKTMSLTGNEFAQTIEGNAGNNVINGGLGADVLTGHGGHDAFSFNTALGAGNVDKITDFKRSLDTFHLSDTVFAGLQPGGLPSKAFFVGAAAHDSSDHIIYNSETGALSFDSDGAGGASQTQFATLSPHLSLTAASFFVT
ncbi:MULTISPECIES: hemolysin [unclassified Mesorhizobium]|uniref:right-handed parallel beta-helix repeat-containing protein n=1 Tax=unclassified Mesorhizobium TaxID=325217 RepID=UPI003338799E